MMASGEPVREQLIRLINGASLTEGNPEDELAQAREILLKRDPTLLPEFFDHMLDFQVARDNRARRFTASFARLAAAHRPGWYLLRSSQCLLFLLCDENAGVLKKAIAGSSEVFGRCFTALCATRGAVSPLAAKQWTVVCKLQEKIQTMVESDTIRSTNEGVRSQAIRFLENVALMYSDLGPNQITGLSRKDGQCLQSIIPGNTVLNRAKLREEGARVVEMMTKLLGSSHLTAGNFQVLIYSLGKVVKERVTRADMIMPHLLEFKLHPPQHITATMEKSMAKAVAMVLGSLLRSSDEVLMRWREPIEDTLADRQPTAPAAIDLHIGAGEEDEEGDNAASSGGVFDRDAHVRRALQLKSQFGDQGAVDLLLQCFTNFPAKPPLPTPVLAVEGVGPHPLVKLVEVGEPTGENLPKYEAAAAAVDAELDSAATARAAAQVQDSVMDPRKRKAMDKAAALASEVGYADVRPAKIARMGSGQSAIGGVGEQQAQADGGAPAGARLHDQMLQTHLIKAAANQAGHGSRELPKSTISTMKKSRPAITVESTFTVENYTQTMRTEAWKRLLGPRCLHGMNLADASSIQRTMLARIARSQPLKGEFHEMLLSHIAEDPAARTDLAIDWLFHEFAATTGCSSSVDSATQEDVTTDGSAARYDAVLLALVAVMSEADSRLGAALTESAHTKALLKECPKLTHSAIEVLRGWCQDYSKVKRGLELLKELILERPATREFALAALLDFTTITEVSIRQLAISIVVEQLFTEQLGSICGAYIRNYATESLESLLELPAADSVVEKEAENAKCRIQLYLALCTKEPTLLPRIMQVFCETPARAAKKAIQATSDQTWMAMAKDDAGRAALINVLKTFSPKNGLPYVHRMLHVLSKNAPKDLIEEVKNTYASRVPDVRLLTPFLHTYSSDELRSMLPHLVQLLSPASQNDGHMREALMRLFSSSPCPMMPAELLIALHFVHDCEQRDVARAIQLCITDLPSIFNFAVLAKVLSKLVEETPLSSLFMQTLIASATSDEAGPRLTPTVVVIVLRRCVEKRIWEPQSNSPEDRKAAKLLWKDWLRCVKECAQENKVIAILRALPKAQLVKTLKAAPELHEPFEKHINGLDHVAPRFEEAIAQTRQTEAVQPPAASDVAATAAVQAGDATAPMAVVEDEEEGDDPDIVL